MLASGRAHIGLHRDDALTLLALDLGGARLPANIGEIAERNRKTGAVAHVRWRSS